MREQPVLYMVIPCYNEQEVLRDSAAKLKKKMESLLAAHQIHRRSKICFVNDGSKDKTWDIIRDLCSKDSLFSAINLAHNRGHQNAVTAGLLTVAEYCDAAISMDADLQDDINAIDEMVEKYREGYNIVYGVRKSRKSDSFFKRFTAQSFYRFMQAMGADIIYNHADFRLMDKKALKAFSEFKEVNLFLRGVIPMIGLNHDCVYYERKERLAGESKYPLRKMLALAWQGITSLTNNPIGYIVKLGLAISVISGFVLIWSLVEHFRGMTIAGWTSLIVSLWFLGGLILFSVGIVGEYIGKIYLEVKHRPRFIVQDFIDENARRGGRPTRGERLAPRPRRNPRRQQKPKDASVVILPKEQRKKMSSSGKSAPEAPAGDK
ncbi:MAG: glycosyltransferase family 2 protein [Succiniclasticum sp.]|jgi:glycosyltransferase involved in cell wall biosynthesis